MKVLLLDIETAPHTAHVWSLWNQNVGLTQLMDTGRVLCFAAKWLGSKDIGFFSVDSMDERRMLQEAHWLLDEADAIITYNGKKFDIPTLNKEFLKLGMKPPSPYKHIDLYQVVKKRFRFASNKLDHIAKELGLKGKIKHQGHELWVQCMSIFIGMNYPKAWKQMKRYNIRDVLLLEKVYKKLLPWIENHPNVALYYEHNSKPCCPNCGSQALQRRGISRTKVSEYIRYCCTKCGTWSRTRFTENKKDVNLLTQERTG